MRVPTPKLQSPARPDPSRCTAYVDNRNHAECPEPPKHSPPKHSPQIYEQCERLDKETCRLAELTSELASRMHPVLSLGPPDASNGAGELANEPTCPIAGRLYGVGVYLSSISASLRELLDRLEV